jgi:hypothetical protein
LHDGDAGPADTTRCEIQKNCADVRKVVSTEWRSCRYGPLCHRIDSGAERVDVIDPGVGAEGWNVAVASAFERLLRLRTRRSGRTTFIEIQLACAAALSIADVRQRVEALRTTIRNELPDAEIAVVATPAPDVGG